MTTANMRQSLQFNTLIGVQRCRLVGNNILGEFKTSLMELGGKRDYRLIDTFLNLPDDPKGILKFTRRFGPLNIPPTPGGHFVYPITDYMTLLEDLDYMWRNVRKYSDFELLSLGGSLRFHGGSIIYTAPTLLAFLKVDLITTPVERVRVCNWRECSHPYYVARHLNQQFCSHQCGDEHMRAYKREWWEKHGRAWRAKRG